MNPTLRRCGGALLVGALASSVLAVTPAQAADPIGTISGVVTGTSGPLADVEVYLYQFDGDFWQGVDLPDDAGHATTGVNGGYTLTVPPGDYRVGFYEFEGNYVPEFFDDSLTVEDAQTQMLDAGEALVANAELATAAHITGTVTDPDHQSVTDGASVRAYELVEEDGYTDWERVGEQGFTDENGDYSIDGLPAGTYRVKFSHFTDGPAIFADEYYQNKPSILLATDVTVAEAGTASGIDAQLEADATISGTVTDASGAPIDEAYVTALIQVGDEWDYVADAVTGANGQYTIEGLPAATYRIEFNGTGDLYEVWNNKGSLDEGDNIVVGIDQDVTNKDAQLISGEHAPVPFTLNAAPVISGTPQVGSTLTVTGGSWSPTPSETYYSWFRGQDFIDGATGTTYVPTAADAGQKLSVLVQVYGPDDQYDFTNTGEYGPIVAAPVVTPSVVAPPVVAPPVVAPPVVAPPVVAPAPVLSFSKKIDVAGALTVGSTLKLKNFKALVSRAAVVYKIQWFAGSKKIKKATKSELKVTKALKGKKIFVKVTAISGTTSKTVKVKVGKIK